MKVNVNRLHPNAIIPTRATPGAACFDLHSVDAWNGSSHPADEHARVFGTGLAFEVPEGHVMLIFSRSGHGFKEAVRLSNCVGVIDSDYRGEVKVSLRADGGLDSALPLSKGSRIAQALILPIPDVEMVEVESLSDTARGAGGFGSTGA